MIENENEKGADHGGSGLAFCIRFRLLVLVPKHAVAELPRIQRASQRPPRGTHVAISTEEFEYSPFTMIYASLSL